MKIKLTEMQKFYLEQQHKTERDSRVSDRIKAILLANEDWKQKAIAQVLRIHETTVWGHLNDYLYEQKLNTKSGGSSSKLDETQTQELISHLEQNTYPSTKEIIQYVELKYGVLYTQQGMHDWLSRYRFSYKKPKGTPAKFNSTRQDEFIKKYNALKAALSPDEMIVFMDSMHPTQETKITYGWIRKGVEKLIATVANRKRINVTGAINLATMQVVTQEYDTIGGNATVDFLKKVIDAYPTASKIHVIADGGSAHTSNEVALFLGLPNAVNRFHLEQVYAIKLPSNTRVLTKKIKTALAEVLSKEPELFEQRTILKEDKLTAKQLLESLRQPAPNSKLEMHVLPAYSPNLNPSERLWKVMNEFVRDNKVFATFADFRDAILNFFDTTWDTISSEVRSRINDNFQRLKPVI